MRHTIRLALTLLLALPLSMKAQDLVAGAETMVAPGITIGGSAATTGEYTLIAWTEQYAAQVTRYPEGGRLTLPHWAPAGDYLWYDTPPAIGTNGLTFLVVWCEVQNGRATYLSARVARDLTLLDTTPTYLAATTRDHNGPISVVWSGSEYIVTWPGSMARLNAKGALTELTAMPGVTVAAKSPDTVLVSSVLQTGTTYCGGFSMPWCTYAMFNIVGRTIGGQGVTSAATSITPGTRGRSLLASAASPSGFLVASIARANSTIDPGIITLSPVALNGSAPNKEVPFIVLDRDLNTSLAMAGDLEGFVIAYTITQRDNSSLLKVAFAGDDAKRARNELTIGQKNETTGSLSLIRLSPRHFLLLYPRSPWVGTAGLIARSIAIGTPRMRATR
jgi:hypothetical protein